MEQLLKRKDITAVIGVNDLVAFGALSCVLNSEDKRVLRTFRSAALIIST